MGLENIEAAIKQTKMDLRAEANEKLQKMWDVLIDKIEAIYASSFFEKKECLIKELGTLVNYYLFDGQKAQQIRVEAGLSQTELGGLVFPHLCRHGQARITGFERGVNYPKYRGSAKKYLDWLKERGYNPYNL